MLRAFLLSIVTLAAAGPALAAGDIDTCRNTSAEAAARLAACESVIADDKITGKSRAAAYGFRGETLLRKRDHDAAIVALSAAHQADPDNVFYVNLRGLAYSNKGDEERALADYDLCLQMRPGFPAAYNNRGLVFMRRGDLQRAFDEFNIAISLNAPANRYINLFNRGRLQTLRKQYEPALADFAEAWRLNPEG
jgi:tetratricopeptide (TPR) repeat protein